MGDKFFQVKSFKEQFQATVHPKLSELFFSIGV